MSSGGRGDRQALPDDRQPVGRVRQELVAQSDGAVELRASNDSPGPAALVVLHGAPGVADEHTSVTTWPRSRASAPT